MIRIQFRTQYNTKIAVDNIVMGRSEVEYVLEMSVYAGVICTDYAGGNYALQLID